MSAGRRQRANRIFQTATISAVTAAMLVYVIAVFLWPASPTMADKTARLAGGTEETAVSNERFGVPSTPESTSHVTRTAQSIKGVRVVNDLRLAGIDTHIPQDD